MREGKKQVAQIFSHLNQPSSLKQRSFSLGGNLAFYLVICLFYVAIIEVDASFEVDAFNLSNLRLSQALTVQKRNKKETTIRAYTVGFFMSIQHDLIYGFLVLNNKI